MFSLIKRFNPLAISHRFREMALRIESLERRLSALDGIVDVLLLDSTFQPSDQAGMNGQLGRKAIVRELKDLLNWEQVIETGTYLGITSGYLATEFETPVFTSELRPRNHAVAKRLLRELPEIHQYLCDSRDFLRKLAQDPKLCSRSTLFYLDAHWYEDLPLAEELQLIVRHWKDFAILIDDFQVPGDPGYTYDDYGPVVGSLTMTYFDQHFKKLGLLPFFPRTPSTQETGKKRGSVVLVSELNLQKLIHSKTLVAYHQPVSHH